jgi:integrase
MARKGHYGAGSIDKSGENSWRLRYRIGGRRYTKVIEGTKTEAAKELRRLLHSGDTGAHVAPDKTTLGQWIDHWISIGAPGRRRKPVGNRSIERYGEILRVHVTPVLGSRPMQQITSTEIDKLYANIETKGRSRRSNHHLHTILNSCFETAIRKKLLAANPIASAEKVFSAGEADHGTALDSDQVAALVSRFKGSPLFMVVATLAYTGCRRNEALALQWSDLDVANKELRIERTLEETKKFGLTYKPPKTSRGIRTITIDDDLLALLVAEQERHRRIIAGIPDGATADVSLVKLPDGALMFPKPPTKGAAFSLTTPRNPHSTTLEFRRKVKALGFRCRLHDLRGAHETALLDANVPLHVVAARCGHDPAVLLRSYAKRNKKADVTAAAAIAAMSKGVLRG